MATSPSPAGNDYVATVIATYTSMPGTPGRASRQDRRLARTLGNEGVPLHIVLAAIIVGAARRHLRSADKPQLAPVRTLSYFLPVIDEMRQYPPDPGYVLYVRAKLTAK